MIRFRHHYCMFDADNQIFKMYIFILLKICMFNIGTTKTVCDFQFKDSDNCHGANTTFESAPNTDDVIHAVQHVDMQNMTYMDSCNITTNNSLKTLIIHKLKRANYLGLSNSGIACLPEDMFNSSAVIKLQTLNLDHNEITVLPDKLFHGPYLKFLIYIDLSFNKISSIPQKLFHNEALENLESIYLQHNRIQCVLPDTIPKHLKILDSLDLSHNQISAMGTLVMDVLENCKTTLFKACKLNLSYNHLTVQETQFILNSNFTRISGYLDISYNRISKFDVNTYTDIGYVTVPLNPSWIRTSGNQEFSVINLVKAAMNIDLNTINEANLAISGKGIFMLHTLTRAFPYVYNCNCDMLKYLTLQTLDSFKKGMNEYEILEIYLSAALKYHQKDLEPSFNFLKCGLPKHLNGQYLENLNETDLQCENNLCTHYNNCICTETPFNDTLRISCTHTKRESMPLLKYSLPNLEIYLGSNIIKRIPENNVLMLQVTVLDLSHNIIKEIPRLVFLQYPRLRVLNMAGNRLFTIPAYEEWRLMHSLESLQLAGNEFPCNCSGLQLKGTLTSLIARSIIKDVNNIKCAVPVKMKNKVIYNLPDSDFGCPFINLVLTLSLTLSLSLFLLAVVFVAYVFRYYIRLFLLMHFGWRFFYTYAKNETLYDVFISYSSKDSDWVADKLVNPLESLNPPYNLCLHERDFLIGVPICDNIEKAIEGSKCTLCVVSKNWLESDWCQFEFRVAHCVATVEKESRLLVILKEEIAKNKIKGDLKYYMKTFTYLDSTSLMFWSRLLHDLPRPDVTQERHEYIELA